MASTIIDMSTLPAPAVVEALDFESIYAAALADFKVRMPEWTAELESDPVLKLLEVFAYREMLIRARVNEAARSVMLAYATGADLDQISALFNVSRLDGESDVRLRLRAQQGFSALGAAGPEQAYRAHALGVSNAILDVSVTSGAPGRVDVCVLGYEIDAADAVTEAEAAAGAILFSNVTVADGEAIIVARNNSALLNAVISALSAETVRPLTDHVVVFAPIIKQTTIVASLSVYRGPDPSTVLAQAQAELSAYLSRIRVLGYDMTRAGIIAALAVPGVQNVVLETPADDLVCASNEVAIATSADITIERITQ